MVETVIAHAPGAARRCWLFRGARTAADAGGRPEGRGARAGCRCASRPLRLGARRLLGWGLALLLLLPHLTLLLVSFVPVGTWTTEPLPAGATRCGNYVTLVAGPGARCGRCVNRLWMATVATVAAVALGARGGAVWRSRRRARGRPADRGAARAAVGGARAPSSPSPSRPRSACTRLGRPLRPGRHALDPAARLPRAQPAAHRPRDLAGLRGTRSRARRGGGLAGRRPLAHPPAGDAAAAAAGARGRRRARLHHRARRLRRPPSCSTPTTPARSRSRSSRACGVRTSAWRRPTASC